MCHIFRVQHPTTQCLAKTEEQTTQLAYIFCLYPHLHSQNSALQHPSQASRDFLVVFFLLFLWGSGLDSEDAPKCVSYCHDCGNIIPVALSSPDLGLTPQRLCLFFVHHPPKLSAIHLADSLHLLHSAQPCTHSTSCTIPWYLSMETPSPDLSYCYIYHYTSLIPAQLPATSPHPQWALSCRICTQPPPEIAAYHKKFHHYLFQPLKFTIPTFLHAVLQNINVISPNDVMYASICLP